MTALYDDLSAPLEELEELLDKKDKDSDEMIRKEQRTRQKTSQDAGKDASAA